MYARRYEQEVPVPASHTDEDCYNNVNMGDSEFLVRSKNRERSDVLQQIERCILGIFKSLAQGEPPALHYTNRNTWQNSSFSPEVGLQMKRVKTTSVKFDEINSTRTFSLMLKVMSMMYTLVQENRYCTKRDLYYQDPDFFRCQSTLDDAVDNISCMLEVHRWDLHVLATSKGCVAGDLRIQDMEDNYIDCRDTKTGVLVPMQVNQIKNMYTDAHFVLVVEKDATFQKLLDQGMCQKFHPCILVTGKGFPDINTRMLVRKLWESFQMPVLVLVDADPHGIEIMTVYKYGSRSLAFETEFLAVPALRWLGVLPTDITRLGIPESAFIPLSNTDRKKASDLLQRPCVKHHLAWQQEIERLLGTGKVEIQCLDTISSTFLTDVYLPGKLCNRGWI